MRRSTLPSSCQSLDVVHTQTKLRVNAMNDHIHGNQRPKGGRGRSSIPVVIPKSKPENARNYVPREATSTSGVLTSQNVDPRNWRRTWRSTRQRDVDPSTTDDGGSNEPHLQGEATPSTTPRHQPHYRDDSHLKTSPPTTKQKSVIDRSVCPSHYLSTSSPSDEEKHSLMSTLEGRGTQCYPRSNRYWR